MVEDYCEDTTEETLNSDLQNNIHLESGHMSRRRFLQYGSALFGSSLLAATTYGIAFGSEENPNPDSTSAAELAPNPLGDELAPLTESEVYVGIYNKGIEPYQNIRLHPGSTWESIDSLEEIITMVDYWGGLVPGPYPLEKIEIPVLAEAMREHVRPVHRLYCHNEPSTGFLAFIYKDLDGVSVRYEYRKTSFGYEAVGVTEAGGDSSVSSVSAISSFPPFDQEEKTQEFEDLSISVERQKSLASISDLVEPTRDSVLTFSEAVKLYVKDEHLDPMMAKLYGYIRGAYNPNVARISNGEGKFSGVEGVPIFGNSTERYGLKYGGYYHHAVFLQSALKGLFKDSHYNSSQLSPTDLNSFIASIYSSDIESSSNITNVIACPLSIGPRVKWLQSIVGQKDLTKLDTVMVFSTYNRDELLEIDGELPENVIYCSSVRTNRETGELYIPENRMHIEDKDSQDRYFLFPDETDALGIEYGAEVVDGQLNLIPEYYGVYVSGASLSALTGSAFIAAIASELKTREEPYSFDLLTKTLWELCPKTEVSGQIARVPDMQKVKVFFEGFHLRVPFLRKADQKQKTFYFPSIKKGKVA